LQHLQLAQHLARTFNNKYGETFPVCHAMVAEDASSRLKSLRSSKKMSKSDPDAKSCIYLSDKPDVILEKIKKSITDFTSAVTYEPESRSSVANLILIHSLMTMQTPEEICENAAMIDTGK
jgi:tryptophanyl-tRNA synthetase